jgi:hypothetical protein
MKQKRSNALLARRADLPLAGEIRGVVTVVLEDRFRVVDAHGRGFLFTLGRKCGVSMKELYLWNRGRVPIAVVYHGPPDLGAVAQRVWTVDAS